MKMKLAEWARFYGVHPKTAYKWYREGTMPFPTEKISERVIIVDMPDNNEKSEKAIIGKSSSPTRKKQMMT